MVRAHVVCSLLVSVLSFPFPAVAGPPAAIGSTAGASAGADGVATAGAEAARKFARAVTRRARDGWNLGDLSVDLADDGGMSLSITLASTKAARRFTLTFSDFGGRVTGFSTSKARTPRERRIYPVQAQLFQFLAGEAISGVDYECGSFFLGGLETGVALDPMDHHVVEARHSGWAASSALASALASSLESGLDLVSVEESEDDDVGSRAGVIQVRAIEFSFAVPRDHQADPQAASRKRQISSRVIHVEIDRRDRVVAVEVRRVPGVYPGQVYRRSAKLLKALESRASISRITLAGDDGDSVVLDGELVIDMADFEVGDIECPC